MKTIKCTYLRHHDNSGFVATCWLWTASGGVHALLVLEPTECSTSTWLEPISALINIFTILYLFFFCEVKKVIRPPSGPKSSRTAADTTSGAIAQLHNVLQYYM